MLTLMIIFGSCFFCLLFFNYEFNFFNLISFKKSQQPVIQKTDAKSIKEKKQQEKKVLPLKEPKKEEEIFILDD